MESLAEWQGVPPREKGPMLAPLGKPVYCERERGRQRYVSSQSAASRKVRGRGGKHDQAVAANRDRKPCARGSPSAMRWRASLASPASGYPPQPTRRRPTLGTTCTRARSFARSSAGDAASRLTSSGPAGARRDSSSCCPASRCATAADRSQKAGGTFPPTSVRAPLATHPSG